MYYASLDDKGICTGILHLSGEVNREDYISITEFDPTILGKKYAAGIWEDVQVMEVDGDVGVSREEMLGQQLSDLEIQQLEYNSQATQEREFLGQQLSDLEISTIERGL